LTRRVDPVEAMLSIGERFLRQAQELDDRTAAAIEADAAQADIIALRNLADVSRLRALSAFQACAPFVRPRLTAVEVAPASEPMVSRFERAVSVMSEEQVLDHLRAIANGGKALELIEVADDHV